MKNTFVISFALFVFCCTLSQVVAHNHLIFPVPRNPRIWYDLDNNCENNVQNFPNGNNFQRGQTITPRWSFNNHHGGFVRFSLVPMGQENQGGIFNRPENILHFTCHTKTCGGQGVRFDPGDTIPCTTQITFPRHIRDGNYVLQWIVYSQFGSQGILEKGLPNYTSCANIRIQGGPTDNRQPGRCSFTWNGGERGYFLLGGNRGAAADTCAYFWRTRLGRSKECEVVNKSFMKAGGRPDEVTYCLNNGGLNQWGNGGNAPAAAPAAAAPVLAGNDNNNNNNNNQNNDSQNGGTNSVGRQCARSYVAKQGDRCNTIANANGISQQRVRELNDFVNCNDIWAGTTLCVDN